MANLCSLEIMKLISCIEYNQLLACCHWINNKHLKLLKGNKII